MIYIYTQYSTVSTAGFHPSKHILERDMDVETSDCEICELGFANSLITTGYFHLQLKNCSLSLKNIFSGGFL